MASKFNLVSSPTQQSFRRGRNQRFPSNYSLNARLSTRDLHSDIADDLSAEMGAGSAGDLGDPHSSREVKQKVVYVQDEDDPDNLVPKYVASERDWEQHHRGQPCSIFEFWSRSAMGRRRVATHCTVIVFIANSLQQQVHQRDQSVQRS